MSNTIVYEDNIEILKVTDPGNKIEEITHSYLNCKAVETEYEQEPYILFNGHVHNNDLPFVERVSNNLNNCIKNVPNSFYIGDEIIFSFKNGVDHMYSNRIGSVKRKIAICKLANNTDENQLPLLSEHTQVNSHYVYPWKCYSKDMA